MTKAQERAVRYLEKLGGQLQEEDEPDLFSVTKPVFVWLNGHCFMVKEDGNVDEL